MQTGNSYRSDLKEKILEAATPMFYQHGIRKVKMDDIAKRLRISKRTVYEILRGQGRPVAGGFATQ